MFRPLALVAALVLTAPAAYAADPVWGLLVTPQWLAAELPDGDVVVLHAGDRTRFEAGHIPGARFVAQDALSITGPNGLTLEMPDAARLAQGLAQLGVTPESRIVVTYDARGTLPAATRILFTLNAAGFGERASLLDGGQPAWVAAGLPLDIEGAAPEAAPVMAIDLNARIVSADQVRTAIATGERKVIDARDSVFYTGERAGAGRGGPQPAGHIQSAQSVPYVSLLTPEGAVKPEAELRAAFAAAGVQPGDSIIAYCHVGQQATAVILAARLIGIDAMLYDGSFQDWAVRELPVERATPQQ